LNGVREEARVGQRTPLDVLNAQQELVNARVALVTAQHDRVVASYTLLAAARGLARPTIGPMVTIARPHAHAQEDRDGSRRGSDCGLRMADSRARRDCIKVAQKLRQLGDARRNPPCLILGEQFGCGASAGLMFYLTGSSENH